MKRLLQIAFIWLMVLPLQAFGQSEIVFSEPEWNFGTLNEEAGIQSHQFQFQNRGEYPEVILEVTTTCGCTKVHFERRPILSGEESAIEVRFQPAGQRGTIDRTLTVYGDRRQVIARLKVRGEVIPRALTLEERFPVDVGQGLRLSNNYLPFGTIEQGSYAPVELYLVNASTKGCHIRLIPEQTSGLLELHYPEQLQAGQEGVIRLGYRIPSQSNHYGTLKETYYIEVNGVRQHARLMADCIAVEQAESRPGNTRLEIEPSILRFGEVEAGTTTRTSFTLRNSGEREVVIRAVESPAGVTTNLKPGEIIPKGSSRRFELLLDTRACDYGPLVKRFTIISNDSERPVLQPRLSATVVER